MVKDISQDKNLALFAELNDGSYGTIGGYCEDGFPIYYANEKIAEMLGYKDVEEFVNGIHGLVLNTIHPDDLVKVTKDLNNGNYYEGMTYRTTYRMPKKDGSWIWTIDKGKVIRARDGRLAIISVCIDMSKFIDEQAELERQNLLSKIALENMPGGYHRCSTEQGFPFLYVSDRFLEIFGWTRKEIETEFNNQFINMLHPDDRKKTGTYVHRIEDNYGTNKVSDEIYRMRGKHGYIWVSDATSLVKTATGDFYQGTVMDITSFVQEKESNSKELQRSYDMLNNMQRSIASAGMGIWHIHLVENEKPTMDADAQMLEILGLTGKKLTPEELYDFWYSRIEKEDVDSVLNSIERMKQGYSDENTYRWNHPTLGMRYARCGGTAQKVPGGYNFGGYHSDVDELIRKQKHQQEILENTIAAEKLHSEVIHSLATIYTTIFRIDLDTNNYEILKNTDLKDIISETTGNFDEFKERMISALVAEEMKQEMDKFLDIHTLRGRLQNLNTVVAEYKDPFGHWLQGRFIVKHRDERGIVQAVLYVARDISEEKKLELIQQERLEALSSDYTAIFSCDLIKDTMIPMKVKQTSRLYQDLQYTSSFSNWVKYSFEHVLIKESTPTYLEDFDNQNLMNYLKENHILIARHQTTPNEASQEYFEVRVVPYYEDENSYEVMWAFRSIDDMIAKEKSHQEQLTLLLSAAEQSNKAKTTFLNSMSHDIRTPMNAIIGFTALAQTHLDHTELVQDYLAKISTSGNHLLSLINDILDMSRIESGSVKLEESSVHIPDVLHDLRAMVQGLINSKDQNLFIDTEDVIHEDVVTDKLRLNQVLINIVGNAIKFTPVGGDISIRLVEKPCSIKNYTTYEFSVKDNGIGMSEEFVSHIFDTFSREYSATVSGIQGTGLGMAITKNIVDMMGGKIEVESKLGKGSKFVVTIDVRLADSKQDEEPIKALLGARALVVDDDIDTCRNVCKMLRSIEMRPDWSSSGREAVIRTQDAYECKDEYKVYIIDYLMPDMNGIETVRRIRKVIGVDVPIIVLTAYDYTDFEKEAREAGVTAFVSKPIFMSELRQVLSSPNDYGKRSVEEEKRKYDYTGKKVLVVEDNELNQEIASAILEETGIVVDCVKDGIEAVERINESPSDLYDLVFMDIQMPRMDGYTATREIRTLKDSHKANIPIVAMTANAFEEDKHKALEVGMNAHIVKPINIDEIAKVLDEIFE